jgi:hypothetical protein
MVEALENIQVMDGDPVAPQAHPHRADPRGLRLRRWRHPGLRTHSCHYLRRARAADRGEWYLDDDGHFCPFWPPSYRACYNLRWIVEEGRIAGLRFTELGQGSRFDGRYR